MDNLNAEFELKKDTNNIYAHNLMGVIHDALRESNVKLLPKHVLERVMSNFLPQMRANKSFGFIQDQEMMPKMEENVMAGVLSCLAMK